MNPITESSREGVLDRLITWMNGLGSLLIVGITLLICADIVGRSLFDKPVAGVAEMVSLTIVAVVFLQLGHAVRSDGLERTSVMLDIIARRSPRAGEILNAVYYLIAALVFLALLYGSWDKLLDAWNADEHVGVYGLFVAPVWPMRLVVVIGSAAAALQFLLLSLSRLRAAAQKNNNNNHGSAD